MENKKYILILLGVLCICFLLLGYFNYDKIVEFFQEKEWELADSFATIYVEDLSQVEAGSSLYVLTNSTLELYGSHSKSEYKEDLVTTGLIVDSCDSYTVTITKDTNMIYLWKDSELVWKNSFNWPIMNASVNKNGYVTLIYIQSGYRSSIKILKPTGEELFTTYLASTYALDVEMSYDNKTLYIAEVDTEGIKLKSNIKIIEMTNLTAGAVQNPDVETIPVGTDDLITDIEYLDGNRLWILRDSGIAMLNAEKEIQSISEFDKKNTIFASIKDLENPIVIEKVSTGIFTNETNLKIYKTDETVEVKLERIPQNIDTMNQRIAVNLGDEVLFFNASGKILKRCELEKQLQSVKLFHKGNFAALIFRDRIEFIKL